MVSNGKPPLRFQRYEWPADVSFSAVLPTTSSRCGIYVVHFRDGAAYVGQSTKIMTRLSTHRRTWGSDIVAVDFVAAKKADLNQWERQTIHEYEEKQVPLRNTALVGLPMGDSRLDLEIDRIMQEQWLTHPDAQDYDLSERARLSSQRQRMEANPRFDELSSRVDYEAIRHVLWDYLLTAVPWPHETERKFWTVTVLPSTNRTSRHRRLCAISVNNVETLVLTEDRGRSGTWQPAGFINVALKSGGWRGRRREYRTTGPLDTIAFSSWSDLGRLLQREDVAAGARRTALGLMRKGQGMMGKYHDQDLADDLFTYGHRKEAGPYGHRKETVRTGPGLRLKRRKWYVQRRISRGY